MQFAKIVNSRVDKILAGSKLPAGYTIIPNDHQLQVGDDVRFFSREYKRKSADDCASEGLITVGKNQVAEWENGCYVVKDDYRGEKYWYKETGEQVDFQLGDKPDDTMTKAEPTDGEAVWDKAIGTWYVPIKVLEGRVRQRRTALLERSDFTMLADAPVMDVTGWKKYRQALRDVPQQKGFPKEVVWPSPPKEDEVNGQYVLSASQ